MWHSPRAWTCVLLCISTFLIVVAHPASSQEVTGNIIGHVNVTRGGAPPERVLVSLELRGATINSVYTDGQGTFGFYGLLPNPYTIVINDEHYQPVQQQVVVDASMMTPTVVAVVVLIPNAKPAPAARPAGSNPDITDVREYTARFPKRAVSEFEKGVKADSSGNKEEAIRHYQKSVKIAPDFYQAHNNLGADYLNKSDFRDARTEFAAVIRLNQSDVDAYFNLSNVCMLTEDLASAQEYLNEGLRRQPDSPLGQFLLGSLNLRLGKFDSAEAALKRAIQLNPAMPQARLQLVNALMREKKMTDAAGVLHDFLAAFPDSQYTPQAKSLLQKLQTSPAAAAQSSR